MANSSHLPGLLQNMLAPLSGLIMPARFEAFQFAKL